MAPAVAAENAPPEHFLNATIASQRDNLSRTGFYRTPLQTTAGEFFYLRTEVLVARHYKDFTEKMSLSEKLLWENLSVFAEKQ